MGSKTSTLGSAGLRGHERLKSRGAADFVDLWCVLTPGHRRDLFFTHVRGLDVSEHGVFWRPAIAVAHFLHVSVVLMCQNMVCFSTRSSP